MFHAIWEFAQIPRLCGTVYISMYSTLMHSEIFITFLTDYQFIREYGSTLYFFFYLGLAFDVPEGL